MSLFICASNEWEYKTTAENYSAATVFGSFFRLVSSSLVVEKDNESDARVGEVCRDGNPRRQRGTLPAHLRQRSQATHLHLQEIVLARLLRQRPYVQRLEILSRAQRIAEIHLVIAIETRA